MSNLQLYRKGNPTITIPIDESTVYLDELMGRNDVTCSFYSDVALDIKVDDYILLNGVRYTINVPYQVIRGAELQYTITFEHPLYWLKDIALRHLGTIEFSYFGTPQSFIQLIVENMNVEDSGWSVGTCEVMYEINIDFYASGSGYNCKGALQLIAEQFGLEYWFSGDGKTINITKEAGVDTNIDFQYGRSRGLYSVERGIIETPLFNRIYGFGGSNNLSQTYRSGAKRLVFSPGYVERPLADGERRRETTVVFEDIFPQRTSTFTTVSSDGLTLADPTIDFDLNGQRINGTEAKVIFKSGALSGKEFEISKYNHSTKQITIKPITDANGYTFPNSTFAIENGDKYTLIGIAQPSTYVEDAENRLKLAVENSFKQVSRPPYKVEIDEKYMRENGFKLRSGDRVRLIDTKIGIDDKIRITSVSFPLVNQNKCTVVISDKITYTRDAEFKIEKDKVKEQIKIVDRTKSEANRVQSLATRQFRDMVFDPDNNLQGTFQALMIEAMSAVFGTDSQNFDLIGIFIKPNSDNNPNKITFTAGDLIHYSYSIEGVGNTWVMAPYSNDTLVSGSSYYISAKVSRAALTGVWVLSTTPIGTEDEAGYWHFNLGVISSVIDGQRFTNITKGYTFISGGQIVTESLIARYFQTATSGSRTSINVLPTDSANPTANLTYYNIDAIRQYHPSGRISMYEGIVQNLTITVSGTPRTISGHAKIVFKDAVGSPIHYVIDSTTANGFQYVSASDSIQYYEITGHRLITSSLDNTASDADLLNVLFTYYPASDIYVPKSIWCGYYERAIYSLSLGLSADASSIWQRVATTGTTYVTANNGTTPIAAGWYYRLGYYMDGNATYTDDSQIIFDLNLQLQYVNLSGEVHVTKDLLINNIQWYQGGTGTNSCSSITPQIQIQ